MNREPLNRQSLNRESSNRELSNPAPFTRSTLSRRQFILATSATLIGAACTGSSGSAKAKPATDSPGTLALPTGGKTAATSAPKDGILVVVELNGGNDAINTVVPITGKYHDIRPKIGHADDTLLALPGTKEYGLHPDLVAMKDLFGAGRVTTLAGVGFANPTRSHFAALDMWWQATPGTASPTGWLGRGLDEIAANSPVDSSAVSLGPSGTALAATKTHTTAVNEPKRFRLEPTKGADKDVLAQSWAALSPDNSDALAAIGLFANLTDADPSEDDISDTTGGKTITGQLVTAARLIASDPTIRTIYISAHGFDTHADQIRRHSELMKDLSVGIRTFFERMAIAKLDNRIMLMTTSEFGRRTYENASGGTDHGKAGALFIVSPNSSGTLYGGLNLDDLDDGDLKPQIDPRSLYAVGLDWLGADSDTILKGSFERFV